jgi:hypothetical protein
MKPRRRLRRNRLRGRPLLGRAARANHSRLQRVKRRLQRRLDLVNDRLTALEEIIEEDTPYQVSGAFEDMARFVEPGRRNEREEPSPKESPKRSR